MKTLHDKFNQGLALHRQGKMAEAESIYREILQGQPNHFDALHMLGVIALHTRRIERAVDLIRQAIGLNASVAAAHNNLERLMNVLTSDETLGLAHGRYC